MTEGAHDHPHARGEDERFRLFFVYELNVDEARRLIASGDIRARRWDMPVRAGGERLLSMDPAEFGSAPSGGPYAGDTATNLFANLVERDRLASIPADRMGDPALMVMWDTNRGTRLTNPRAKEDPALRPTPQLVDGSHRLARRFLEGDTGTMPTLVVEAWEDICRFLSVRGRKVAPPKGAKGARRAAAPEDTDDDTPASSGPRIR